MSRSNVAESGVDEFAEAAESQNYMSGYFATADEPVEDQREYRLIPKGTPATLGIQGFELDLGRENKGKPRIAIKCEVIEPEEYADGSSNFTVRLSLNPVRAPGKKQSGWDMTRRQLAWLYASAKNVSAAEGTDEMLTCVISDFTGATKDDERAFHLALVENANEKLKGAHARVSAIGVDVGQAVIGPDGQPVINDDGTPRRFADRQSFGTFIYPKGERK